MKKRDWQGNFIDESIKDVIDKRTRLADREGAFETLQQQVDVLLQIVVHIAEALPEAQQIVLANHLMGYEKYE